jgi:hypothetical protein
MYKSESTKTHLKKMLDIETVRLDSIIHSKDAILALYSKYQDLTKISIEKKCINRIDLIDRLKTLINKYQLIDDIEISTLRQFTKQTINIRNSNLNFNHYNIALTFNGPNINMLINIINDIDLMLASFGQIIWTKIQRIETIDPEIIYKLSTKRTPNMFYISIEIAMKEIIFTNLVSYIQNSKNVN